MKKILRSAVLVAGIATSVTMGMTSANAAATVAFHGTAKINSFGTGASAGTASLTVAGSVSGSVSATFTVFEDPASCPATGTASGEFTGAVTGKFTWTRVGATAVVTVTEGTYAGATGSAAFAVTSPAGNPCGKTNVQATVAGNLVLAP